MFKKLSHAYQTVTRLTPNVLPLVSELKSTAPTVSIDKPTQVLVPSIIKLILQNVRVVLIAMLDVKDVTIQYVNAR